MIGLAIVLLVLCLAFLVILLYRGYLNTEQERKWEIEQQVEAAMQQKQSQGEKEFRVKPK